MVRLDATGQVVQRQHLVGLIGAYFMEPGQGQGGIAGEMPMDGRVVPTGVAVDAEARIAVTGSLTGVARFGDVVLNGGYTGRFTAVYDSSGAQQLAVLHGGIDVVFGAGGHPVVWDGSTLFGVSSTHLWNVGPAGTLLPSWRPGRLVPAGDRMLLAASFVGQINLGSVNLESAGCADGFVAMLGP